MSKLSQNNFVTEVINNNFGLEIGSDILKKSSLIRYLAIKTKSVNSSSKARGSFANLYALYVLIEDYISKNYSNNKEYYNYQGMMFTDAFKRQRELPFGEKLQNHALNSRCNDEFKKYFKDSTSEIPIIRNLDTKRYWINEKLLLIPTSKGIINISSSIIEVINKYMELKIEDFQAFFNNLESIKNSYNININEAKLFILNSLQPEVDARIFEIVSFVILKYYYLQFYVLFGKDQASIKKHQLILYKTGRTNANDGGIDYIMLPTGRIFQVTEVLDFKKYFLDIHKINHYPITFVVKQKITPKDALYFIQTSAKSEFGEDISTLNHYLNCFEEIITIPVLEKYLDIVINNGNLGNLIDELIIQCKVEYNLTDIE